MRKLVVTVVALAVLVPATALAGGWATVQLSSTPKGAKAGVPWVVNLTVLQHGVTPLDEHPAARADRAGAARTAVPRASDREGRRLQARVVFPRAGTWRWSIWDGFSRTHTYKAVKVAPAAI